MALERGKLTEVVPVAAAATTDIITVASNKKVYVKSIVLHTGSSGGTAATAEVYFIPNGGSAGDTTRIFKVDISTNETILLEPAYPLVLTATGDKISVKATTATVNVLITGDKEA